MCGDYCHIVRFMWTGFLGDGTEQEKGGLHIWTEIKDQGSDMTFVSLSLCLSLCIILFSLMVLTLWVSVTTRGMDDQWGEKECQRSLKYPRVFFRRARWTGGTIFSPKFIGHDNYQLRGMECRSFPSWGSLELWLWYHGLNKCYEHLDRLIEVTTLYHHATVCWHIKRTIFQIGVEDDAPSNHCFFFLLSG